MCFQATSTILPTRLSSTCSISKQSSACPIQKRHWHRFVESLAEIALHPSRHDNLRSKGVNSKTLAHLEQASRDLFAYLEQLSA